MKQAGDLAATPQVALVLRLLTLLRGHLSKHAPALFVQMLTRAAEAGEGAVFESLTEHLPAMALSNPAEVLPGIARTALSAGREDLALMLVPGISGGTPRALCAVAIEGNSTALLAASLLLLKSIEVDIVFLANLALQSRFSAGLGTLRKMVPPHHLADCGVRAHFFAYPEVKAWIIGGFDPTDYRQQHAIRSMGVRIARKEPEGMRDFIALLPENTDPAVWHCIPPRDDTDRALVEQLFVLHEQHRLDQMSRGPVTSAPRVRL